MSVTQQILLKYLQSRLAGFCSAPSGNVDPSVQTREAKHTRTIFRNDFIYQ